MANVKEMRIFAAEQIDVPDEFPGILKNFIKEVVRRQPDENDFITFSRQYFEDLLKEKGYFNAPVREKVEFTTKEFYLSHQLKFKEQYKMGETIGYGGLSTTRKCYHKMTGEVRAVKVTKKEDLEFGERQKLLQEIEILKELDHPSICRVIDIFEDKKKFYFVQEYLSGGGLFDSLIQNVGFTEHASATIIRQILSAVAYLHSKKIAHRDIKPENILFESNDALNVKLLDFGNSRKMGENEAMHGVFGTAYYVAPEVLYGDYDEKCDIWSIGVILYMLLSGNPPFNGHSDIQIIEAVKKGEYSIEGGVWDEVSTTAKDLALRMLTHDPKQRISAADALHHPWFEHALKEGAHKTHEKLHAALDNFRKFSSGNKLKQAALGFMIQHFMSQKEAQELEDAFNRLDKDGSGTLSKEELIEGYRMIYGDNFNEGEVDALLNMADENDDGVISYSEWLMTAMNRQKILIHEKLEAAF